MAEIETLQWDPTNDASADEAERTFDRLKREGMEFFRVKTQEVQGKAVKKFHRKAGKLMYAPSAVSSGSSAMRGGPPASVETAVGHMAETGW